MKIINSNYTDLEQIILEIEGELMTLGIVEKKLKNDITICILTKLLNETSITN